MVINHKANYKKERDMTTMFIKRIDLLWRFGREGQCDNYVDHVLYYIALFMLTNTVGKIMKIINTFSGVGEQMAEDEVKSFMTNNDNDLLIRLGIIDEKGEPNVAPFAYYYDNVSNSIYFTTRVTTKKVSNLRRRNIVCYCIDDPDPPFKGVRGKGIIKFMKMLLTISPIPKLLHPLKKSELSVKLTR